MKFDPLYVVVFAVAVGILGTFIFLQVRDHERLYVCLPERHQCTSALRKDIDDSKTRNLRAGCISIRQQGTWVGPFCEPVQIIKYTKDARAVIEGGEAGHVQK